MCNMPAQEVDTADLARRVTQLEKELERIGERATRREDDWGTVRSKADRVDALRDEVRELRHLVGRSAGSVAGDVLASAAPPAAPAAAPSTQSVSNAAVVNAVMEQLKGRAIPTSKDEVVALVRQAIVDDLKVRQAIVAWLLQDLQQRGITIPPVLPKRAAPPPAR
jgi:hypothetical protein